MPTDDIKLLASKLLYNAKTGGFVWICKPSPKIVIGSIAGCLIADGYTVIRFKQKQYLAHRLAWLISYGEMPRFEIDHINGDRTDNRIENLRDVSRKTNSENIRRPYSTNKCGFLGVHVEKKTGKFKATIFSNGRTRHIGLFHDAESAHEAYITEKRRIHAGATI